MRCMSTARKVLLTVGGLVVALILAAAAALYVYGPTVTAMYTGTARFFGTDTPKRYTSTVLDLAGQGLYADTPEFAEASTAAREAAENAETLDDIRPALDKAVQAAGGKHSKLFAPATGDDDEVDDEVAETKTAGVAVSGGVAVVTVPGVDRHADIQAYADALSSGLIQARDDGACGAIVDLRGNGGGDMGPMLAGLSPLLPDGEVLEFVTASSSMPVNVSGNAVNGGGSALETAGGKWDAPTAVLVDEYTASSGEATMLSFRGLERSRSFGEPTAGYASANMVYDFPDGSTMMLTIARDRARTGETFAEDPIRPDAGGGEADALVWLAEEHGCR